MVSRTFEYSAHRKGCKNLRFPDIRLRAMVANLLLNWHSRLSALGPPLHHLNYFHRAKNFLAVGDRCACRRSLVCLESLHSYGTFRPDLCYVAPRLLHPPHRRRTQGRGIIRNEDAFILWHYLHRGRSLKAGEYLFDKSRNMVEVHNRLARGEVYFHTVVVPEGFTMFDIARAVEAAGLGPGADFLKEAQSDVALIADLAPSAPSLEGYLFPDTYQFSRMMTMHDMAAAMVKTISAGGQGN